MFEQLVLGLSLPVVWVAFAVCLLIIYLTGTRLSRYGDAIAVRTGLGGVWIGLVLLAVVTSLPELVTGVSAVLVVGQPDLAVASALGSCVYNLAIIAVLDVVHRGGTIYDAIRHSHNLSAGFGVILLGAAAAALFIQQNFQPIGLGPIGPFSIAAPILYFIAMRSVFYFERAENRTAVEEVTEARALARVAGTPPLSQVLVLFALNALILVAAATLLPVIGEALANGMGWKHTFVGSIFLALVTSVPELVISVEAVRIGAVDLAIGGLLGSNLFDLLILAIADLAYMDGPILAAVGSDNLLTAIAALLMMGIAIVGLYSRPRARFFGVAGWASVGLFSVAVVTAVVLYLIG